ncbi:hypothetical protein MMC09_005560 [Bachmanniomyces sp. S44760]|nr:hypothetical protein [Bachmanniomyces sp. S44760]
MAKKMDYNALRKQTMGQGQDEEAVTVNTRALIDKVLARYSGEWTVLRELLQNAADASASKVTIKFETLPSSAVPLPRNSEASSLVKHTILNHSLKRMVVTNNGQAFQDTDWSRLKRIAEGNPDETKIGAFGVGFYSVFADCEEPFVSSGSEAMAFYWKGNSLFTRRMTLSPEQSSPETSFVLDFRNTTSPVPDLLPLCQFLASSLTFVGLTSIDLYIDDWRVLQLTKLTAPGVLVQIPKALETKTLEGLMQVTSVVRETAQLDARWMNIVAWKPKAMTIQALANGHTQVVKPTPSGQSLRNFFHKLTAGPKDAAAERAAKEEQASQEAISENLTRESTATVFLHINTSSIRTSVNKAFGVELERATKKTPPKTTSLAVLTSSYDGNPGSSPIISGIASKSSDIFASVLPTKSGRIFIGFPTHQTTGLNAHISAQSVIPTVERESIDLNARWVRTWNQELLRAAGIVCRVAWSGEMDAIKEMLSINMAKTTKRRIEQEDVVSVLPEAIHVLNQFTFRESTPSLQVGSLIEEAFWTCNKKATIDILSSCGVLPSQDVRMSTDDLSFVGGIPVLPEALIKQADGFIRRLTDYGIITDITISDIKKELESKALTSKQLVEFLDWIAQKGRIKEFDSAQLRSLLSVAIANDEENGIISGRVIVLGEIKHFLNPSKIPGSVPIPPNTIPFKYTKGLDKAMLEYLGWEDLQIVPWLRWLVENAGGRGQLADEFDITRSTSFVGTVLPIVSKQWEGLSPSSKSSVIELLATRTVIPTQTGMQKPNETYFPTVKLFDDLPVVRGLQGVKEKFLGALGVRKTVELGLVFERLMTPPDCTLQASKAQPKWNHVDLIKYLASVRNDIPSEDIKRLKTTPICPAEADTRDKATSQLYRVVDLYEPHAEIRSLGLKVLYWPGAYRSGSDEAKFLKYLGLQTAPNASELFSIAAAAVSRGDLSLRDRTLHYFIDFHHTNKYSTTRLEEVDQFTGPFLPLEGGDDKRAVLPSQCFTSPRCAILGFDILRSDLQPHASKFGVQIDPPISTCINRLVSAPPEGSSRAREVFGYFASRLNEIREAQQKLLENAKIVPIASTNRALRKIDSRTDLYVSPRLCFLGTGDKYAEIFDYVDFGLEANSFLLRCGSKHEPSVLELAHMLVKEPTRIFSLFQNDSERYLDLLRTLAEAWSVLKKDKILVKEMKQAPFLLACKELSDTPSKQTSMDLNADDDDDDNTIKTWQLAQARKIIIVDDVNIYNIFKPHLLAAPLEETVENLYINLGAPMLETLVKEQTHVGTPNNDQQSAIKLRTLLQERARLFLHDTPREQIHHDAKWIEKNLKVIAVDSLSLHRSLSGTTLSHKQARTAATVWNQSQGWILYFTPANNDLFQVSQAVAQLLLSRPKVQQTMILEMLLTTNLLKLKSRGYNVDRILRQKAAEARIAEEQQRKQLVEEQQMLRDREKAFKESGSRNGSTTLEQNSMPGVFPEAPDRHSVGVLAGNGLADDDQGSRRPRGLFSNMARSLGFDDGRRGPALSAVSQDTAGTEAPPPPYSHTDIGSPKPPVETPKAITAPRRLQQNLVNAIRATRPHNSQDVISQPSVNEITETATYCDAKPAQNISLFGDSKHGLKIYLSNEISDKADFIARNSSAFNNFSDILLDVADVFHAQRSSLHMYYDASSSTIAFNSKGALFFNYRYFEVLHLPDVQQGKNTDAIIYWFVVMCHEIAHNLVGTHSSEHSYYM